MADRAAARSAWPASGPARCADRVQRIAARTEFPCPVGCAGLDGQPLESNPYSGLPSSTHADLRLPTISLELVVDIDRRRRFRRAGRTASWRAEPGCRGPSPARPRLKPETRSRGTWTTAPTARRKSNRGTRPQTRCRPPGRKLGVAKGRPARAPRGPPRTRSGLPTRSAPSSSEALISPASNARLSSHSTRAQEPAPDLGQDGPGAHLCQVIRIRLLDQERHRWPDRIRRPAQFRAIDNGREHVHPGSRKTSDATPPSHLSPRSTLIARRRIRAGTRTAAGSATATARWSSSSLIVIAPRFNPFPRPTFRHIRQESMLAGQRPLFQGHGQSRFDRATSDRRSRSRGRRDRSFKAEAP